MTKLTKKIKKPILGLLTESSLFHVEIDKSTSGVRLVASGVKRISELSESVVCLKCGHSGLRVLGSGLSLSLYEDKSVEISGKLEVIEFADSKN